MSILDYTFKNFKKNLAIHKFLLDHKAEADKPNYLNEPTFKIMIDNCNLEAMN
jgi:hypothetical protein